MKDQICSFEMQSALDLLSQHENIEKMSTGSAEVDWLIDGMQKSLFYLFYSTPENQIILDSFLIDCWLVVSYQRTVRSAALNLWPHFLIILIIVLIKINIKF
jgi:hypothetical protein